MKKKTNKTILLPLIAICLLLTATTPITTIPEDDTTQILPLEDKNSSTLKNPINNN